VILPRQNEKNIKEDLSEDLRKDMTLHLVSTIDEVLQMALKPNTVAEQPTVEAALQGATP
jgi:ATP-dependent Lon protease